MDEKNNFLVGDGREELRSMIRKEHICQAMFICGYDNENHCILMKYPKTSVKHMSKRDFLMTHVYLIERAIACTERRSLGKREKIVVTIDYSNQHKESAPSLAIAKEVILALQAHYPERLHNFIASDTGMVFRFLWRIVSTFIDPDTRNRIHIIKGMVCKE